MPDPTPADDPVVPAPAADPAAPTPAVDPAAPAPVGDPAAPAPAVDPAAPASFDGLSLQEGFTLSQDDFTALSGLFEDAGTPLTQGMAQKLVDLEQSRMASLTKASEEAQQALLKEWEAQSRNDKEFGGERFDANLVIAQEALDALATPELRDLLQKSGMGNHPEMLRLFVKLGPLVREAGAGGGRQSSAQPVKDRASRMYGANNQ